MSATRLCSNLRNTMYLTGPEHFQTGESVMRSMWLKSLMFGVLAVLLAGRIVAQDTKGTDADSSASAKAGEKTKQVVPVFRLSGSLKETPTDDSFPFATEHTHALKDITQRMKKAAEDKNVKAVIVT